MYERNWYIYVFSRVWGISDSGEFFHVDWACVTQFDVCDFVLGLEQEADLQSCEEGRGGKKEP